MDPAPSARSSPPNDPRAYEELEGASGAAINFRLRRYSLAELEPLQCAVSVRLDGDALQCALHDVSQSGLAVRWPASPPPPAPGSLLPAVTVHFEGQEAYRGAAVVSSVREVDGAPVVGASFCDALLDLERFLRLREIREWAERGGAQLVEESRPWHTRAGERFRAKVADFRLFLEDARETLGRLESELSWSLAYEGPPTPALTALKQTLRAGFVADFVRLHREVDAALREAPAADGAALRAFSLRHLDPLILSAPFFHRARHKPRGYPGDFQVMQFIYEKQFEGASLFARAVHLAGVHTDGAAVVRSRKELVKSLLTERIQRSPPQREFRIASIAAGPAQETYELLASLEDVASRIEIVLFDQDPDALTLAFSRIKQVVDARWASRVKVRFLHDSIKRLIRDPSLLAEHGPFDVIICAGLFDYLERRHAATLSKSFYQSLRADGSAYVGNVVPELPSRWLMEHHLDWALKYKTRDEMRAFVLDGCPDAEVSVVEESVGYNPFVTFTRRG